MYRHISNTGSKDAQLPIPHTRALDFFSFGMVFDGPSLSRHAHAVFGARYAPFVQGSRPISNLFSGGRVHDNIQGKPNVSLKLCRRKVRYPAGRVFSFRVGIGVWDSTRCDATLPLTLRREVPWIAWSYLPHISWPHATRIQYVTFIVHFF